MFSIWRPFEPGLVDGRLCKFSNKVLSRNRVTTGSWKHGKMGYPIEAWVIMKCLAMPGKLRWSATNFGHTEAQPKPAAIGANEVKWILVLRTRYQK